MNQEAAKPCEQSQDAHGHGAGFTARLLRWWRQDTIQGVALAFMLIPCVGSWQIPVFCSLTGGGEIVHQGGLYTVSLIPLLGVFAYFAARARATIRRCVVAAIIVSLVYPLLAMVPVYQWMLKHDSSISWAGALVYWAGLASALSWPVFMASKTGREPESGD